MLRGDARKDHSRPVSCASFQGVDCVAGICFETRRNGGSAAGARGSANSRGGAGTRRACSRGVSGGLAGVRRQNVPAAVRAEAVFRGAHGNEGAAGVPRGADFAGTRRGHARAARAFRGRGARRKPAVHGVRSRADGFPARAEAAARRDGRRRSRDGAFRADADGRRRLPRVSRLRGRSPRFGQPEHRFEKDAGGNVGSLFSRPRPRADFSRGNAVLGAARARFGAAASAVRTALVFLPHVRGFLPAAGRFSPRRGEGHGGVGFSLPHEVSAASVPGIFAACAASGAARRNAFRRARPLALGRKDGSGAHRSRQEEFPEVSSAVQRVPNRARGAHTRPVSEKKITTPPAPNRSANPSSRSLPQSA